MSDNLDPEKLKETAESTQEVTEAFKQLMKLSKDLEKGIKNLKGGFDEANDSLRESADFGKGLGDKLGDLMGTTSGLNANLSRLVSAGVDTSSMFDAFSGSITKNFNAMAIGVSVIEKTIEATTALVGVTDAAMVSFQKQTGAASTYGTQIMALERSLYLYGVTIDEAGESTAALVTGIKNFDEMNSSAQKDLMETTAILGEMGIESQITAQNMNFLTNSMGLLPEEAASATRSMLVLAKELKTPPQEMAAAFQSAQPRLAAFGANAGAVFQKLAKNAHNANMEIDAMLRISEQFDKFDTAANSVGSLNAALGGPYLSTIRMVTTTDPTDRLKMMSDAARQAGKSFDNMEYYERKMLASAMGLESVNELALVMAGRFDDVVKPVKLTTDEIIKQEEALTSYNSLTEEFAQLWREFAVNIAGPVIKGLKSMFQFIQNMASSGLPMLIVGVLGTAAAMGLLWSAIGGPLGPIVGAIVLLVGMLVILGKTVYDLLARSKPFMDVFGPFWEKLTTKISEFGKKASPVFSNFQKFIDEAVIEMMPAIEEAFNHVLKSVDILLTAFGKMNKFFSDIGLYSGIMEGFAFVFQIVAAVAIAAVKAFAALSAATASLMTGDLQGLYHLLYIGNSPSLIAVFGLLGDAITSVGNAFMYPIKMIGKMMTGLKDLASLLAGKALSFISGAISYVFGGGSPETEVNNGGFKRKEDMESMAVSIGDEVAKAVKEALEGVQMNNKIQLEVSAENGLPQLFDYVIRGVDDKYSNRPINHTLNASRAGIK
jgi:uncharacterized protein YjgD (DUF1641 family)